VSRLRLLALPLLLALVAVAAACGGGGDGGSGGAGSDVPVPDGAVAVVAGTTVTKADFDELFKQAEAAYKAQQRDFPAAGSPEYETLKSRTVSFLVQRVEFEKEAAGLGITVTDADVDKKLADLKQQFFGGDDAKYQAELKKLGLSEASLRDQLRASLLSQKIYDKVTKDVTVTDAEIRKYYDDNIDQFTKPETRDVAHILVKTKAEAEKIRQQLLDGADFAELAKKFSTDTQSGKAGGDLGAQPKETYVKPFGDAAWALKTGEISEPVKSQFGWHIIKALSDVTPKKVTPFDEVKDTIRSQLLETKKNKAMQAWVDQVNAKYASQIGYAVGFAPAQTETSTSAHTGTGAG
jgi:parvulin-like peptidyl-prolyl isomerase